LLLSETAAPRVRSVPQFQSSRGEEACDLARAVGIVPDPWQEQVIHDALGERENGRWTSFEVGAIVPRQNGKGTLLEIRELAGLFLFDEQLILHSAHEFKTAAEAFRRVLAPIENNDFLRKHVKKVRTSHGEEGVELKNGNRLRFVARSTGSGRGFSGDCVILDEAYNLPGTAMAALLPTMSARPNPQLWYTSSAPLDESETLIRLRDRGRAGTEQRLAYFEFSAPADADLDDQDAWAQANPALGIRISPDFVAMERSAMGEVEFARERLGISGDARRSYVIDPAMWATLADVTSRALDPVAFAFDVTPDSSSTAIASAGRRADGRLHVEVVDQHRGTGWAVDRLVELVGRWRPCAVMADPSSPAGALFATLAERGVEVVPVGARDMGKACGDFKNRVTEGQLAHLGQPALSAALDGARPRPVGDTAWAWHRRDSSVDISPLVAATLAVYGWQSFGWVQPDKSGISNAVYGFN